MSSDEARFGLLFITMEFSYLVVCVDNFENYEVIGTGFVDELPEKGRVGDFLDIATRRVCQLMKLDSDRGLVLTTYILVHPLPSFCDQPLAVIRNQLGDINKEFFDTKTIGRSERNRLSSIQANETHGKVIVLCWCQKRARSVTLEEAFSDRLKRAKLVATAPSTLAQPAEYVETQKVASEKILDDRPEPDADIPPIPLLYDGFGQFVDVFHGSTNIPGYCDVDIVNLEEAVDDFAEKMTRFYPNDDERRDAGLVFLNRIFSARTGYNIPALQAGAIGSVRSDGHIIATNGGVGIVTEFKNWLANINAIPEVKIMGYVARSHAGMVDRGKSLERWRIPSLGLTIVDADVRFYAIVPIGLQYRRVNLTPTLSCIRSASDGWDRKALYRAFTAASIVEARILQAVETLTTTAPDIPMNNPFPGISRLRIEGSPTDYLTFQIKAFHPDRQPYRLLYVAETTGLLKQEIIVKFVRQYSIDLHQFCAAHGHAPKILAYECLPGGWWAIAMDFIVSGIPISCSTELVTHRERWMKQLRALVLRFHAKGLVHGDLRDVNMICDDKHNVLLIDFDWSGNDGEVCYPTSRLNKELLDGRTSLDLKITKNDDIRVLGKTLEKLTSKI